MFRPLGFLQLLAKLGEEEAEEIQLGDYAGDDDCGLKEEDVGVVDLADAGVEFLVHGHQVLLVCNTWNGGSRTRVVETLKHGNRSIASFPG